MVVREMPYRSTSSEMLVPSLTTPPVGQRPGAEALFHSPDAIDGALAPISGSSSSMTIVVTASTMRRRSERRSGVFE